MPRPKRKRKLGYLPENHRFCPDIYCKEGNREVIISLDELESIRLSDFEELEQTEASEKMDISRGTYQRILVSAHKKVADALIHGRAIKVEGGSYTLNDCSAHCQNCGHKWSAPCNELFDTENGNCPKCGEKMISCAGKKGECCLGERRHKEIIRKHRCRK